MRKIYVKHLLIRLIERRKRVMWIKNDFLLFFGLCAGGIIAAGVYAFLAIIGVFVRMIG